MFGIFLREMVSYEGGILSKERMEIYDYKVTIKFSLIYLNSFSRVKCEELFFQR